MDPIGFGLERYDKTGKYREHDDGAPECSISGDGVLAGVGDFNGPAELADLLISSDNVQPCVVRHLVRFALGRGEDVDDAALLERLDRRFEDSGWAFDDLILELVSSDAFLLRRDEKGDN